VPPKERWIDAMQRPQSPQYVKYWGSLRPRLTPTSGTPLVDTWGVYFNMLCPNGASVQCTVTRGMLDELAQRSVHGKVLAQWIG
jgi:hypothetical protein